MKSATNYFRNAILAARYPTIEYKDEIFAAITGKEVFEGCLSPENAERIFGDVIVENQDNEKEIKSVVIALKTILTEYEEGELRTMM